MAGNGNITSVSDGTNTTSYVYDTANQLIRENNQAAGKTWTWTYNASGNILSKKTYAYTTGTLGSVVDTVTYTYATGTWKDKIKTYDGVTITSDELGNPLTDGEWTYTWEHGRQLASMSKSGTTVSYTYNADGLRASKTVNGVVHNYIYSGSKLVRETFGDTTLDFSYDSQGNPYTLTYTVGTATPLIYHYVVNLQGDVIRIVNAAGVTRATYEYDAWGNLINMTYTNAALANANPLRYRGYVYDSETGLYYLNSRYYDPEMGRFISADNLVDTRSLVSHNMFAYCWNNPVNMIDVTGEAPKYINSQRDDTQINGVNMRDIRFGVGNIATNGCGVIAAYNVLLSRSSKVSFNRVKSGIISYGGLLVGGKFGVNPSSLTTYMRSKFLFVYTAGPVTKLWGIKAELSESVIVLVAFKNGVCHYIAGIGTGKSNVGGSFRFYNTSIKDKYDNRIAGREISIWRFIESAKHSGATPLYFIGVKGKKGWW